MEFVVQAKVIGKIRKCSWLRRKAIRLSMRSSLETVGVSTGGVKEISKSKGLVAVFFVWHASLV